MVSHSTFKNERLQPVTGPCYSELTAFCSEHLNRKTVHRGHVAAAFQDRKANSICQNRGQNIAKIPFTGDLAVLIGTTNSSAMKIASLSQFQRKLKFPDSWSKKFSTIPVGMAARRASKPVSTSNKVWTIRPQS